MNRESDRRDFSQRRTILNRDVELRSLTSASVGPPAGRTASTLRG